MTRNINEILFRVKIDEHTTLARVGSIVNCVIDNLSNQTTLQSTAMEKKWKILDVQKWSQLKILLYRY